MSTNPAKDGAAPSKPAITLLLRKPSHGRAAPTVTLTVTRTAGAETKTKTKTMTSTGFKSLALFFLVAKAYSLTKNRWNSAAPVPILIGRSSSPAVSLELTRCVRDQGYLRELFGDDYNNPDKNGLLAALIYTDNPGFGKKDQPVTLFYNNPAAWPIECAQVYREGNSQPILDPNELIAIAHQILDSEPQWPRAPQFALELPVQPSMSAAAKAASSESTPSHSSPSAASVATGKDRGAAAAGASATQVGRPVPPPKKGTARPATKTIVQAGDGGIAVGQGAMVAGKGGVVIGGSLQGSTIITGSGNVIRSVVGETGSPEAGGHLSRPDVSEALTAYLRTLAISCSRLPLRGIDVGESDPASGAKHLELDQVYVNLDTQTQVEVREGEKSRQRKEALAPDREKSRPLSAIEAAAQNRHVVLLGDPGSGKSTFLNHLCLCLALNALEPKKQWLSHLPGWPSVEGGLLPMPVVLRDFVRSLPAQPGRAAPRHLWDFIARRLREQKLESGEKGLEDALQDGRALVLLDGLDEIPSADQRAFVRDAVVEFAARYNRSRMVVTCRTLSYQNAAWQLPEDFRAFTLAPFSPEKIDAFINAWYADLERLKAVKPEESKPLAGRLREAIRRPDLWRLAPNPLLLTVMALVHTHKGRLPDARAVLYEETVEILLWRWEQMKLGAQSDATDLRQMLRQTNRSVVDLKRRLYRLAFEAHRAGGARAGDALADISESALEYALADLHPQRSLDWAKDLITTIKLRAGLLLERAPQFYTFPHRTFQEYLAGAHLATQANFATEATRLVGEGAFWREVILLAVGKLVYLSEDTDKPLALAGELCPAHAPQTDLAWRQAWLAGEVLNEITLPRAQESARGRDLLERVPQRLAALLEAGALAPVERAAAGVVLGKLGDPRRGVALNEKGLPDIDWIAIPAGPFLMGCTEADAEYPDEKPQFTCRLIDKPYRISRYPVTVAQYQSFVGAKGYEEERLWTKGGWDWRKREGVTGPKDYGEVHQMRNHPRVGVSWYEAIAYCRWLSEQLGFPVMLPSEAEWERAARGTDGRAFPWGNQEEAPLRCNMSGTGIGHTSAVGVFPSGHAVCGADDVAGNVDEWCRTKWLGDYKGYEKKADNDLDGDDLRVLRGGSWSDVRNYVRCAYRGWDVPADRGSDFGFRVVASPFDSGL